MSALTSETALNQQMRIGMTRLPPNPALAQFPQDGSPGGVRLSGRIALPAGHGHLEKLEMILKEPRISQSQDSC